MARFQGDLPNRTYRFSLVVMSLVDQLPRGTTGWELGKQPLRSGIGVGANVREADVAFTDREFAHLCNIARREAHETHYWLSLCRDHDLLRGDALADAIREADELHRILSTIVQKTQHYLEEPVEQVSLVP